MVLKFLVRSIFILLIIHLNNKIYAKNIKKEKIQNNNIKSEANLKIDNEEQMNYYDYTKEHHGTAYIPKFVNQNAEYKAIPTSYNREYNRKSKFQVENFKRSNYNNEYDRNIYSNNDLIVKALIKSSRPTVSSNDNMSPLRLNDFNPNQIQNNFDDQEEDDELTINLPVTSIVTTSTTTFSTTTSTTTVTTTTTEPTSTLPVNTKPRNLALVTKSSAERSNRRRKPAEKNENDNLVINSSKNQENNGNQDCNKSSVRRFIMQMGMLKCETKFGYNCCFSSIENSANQYNKNYDASNELKFRKKQMMTNAFQRRTNFVKMLKMQEQNSNSNNNEEKNINMNDEVNESTLI
jgi:hypothetical protein